jgi:OOP family OmpA-OmpF porin
MKIININILEKKMKIKTLSKLGLFTLSIISSSLALATDNGWYVGGNIGSARAKIDDAGIAQYLQNNGFSSSIRDNNRSGAGKIYGGYQINENWAVEGGYFNLGNFGYTATTNPIGTLNGDIKIQGVNLDLVGMVPLSKSFSAFGRVGVTHSQSRDHFTSTGAVNVINPNPRENSNNWKAGLGLQYALSDRTAIRGEVERYRVRDAIGHRGDVNMVSVGLVYHFGANPTPVKRVSYIEPERVEAPMPIQETVVVEQKPIMQVNLAADSLFDFNKSTIKMSGREALDKFGSDVSMLNYDTINVVGHTDRIGSDEYNQKLSESRALSVKMYLVEHANIPPQRINTQGMGERSPVTGSECVGNKPTAKLVACLQPDRRVDLTVQGTHN